MGCGVSSSGSADPDGDGVCVAPGGGGGGAAAAAAAAAVSGGVGSSRKSGGTMSASKSGSSAHRPVVVEMFTSHGCSSCPSADSVLSRLVTEGADVIPLSMHVDYWDHIGDADAHSSAAATQRQRAYCSVFQSRSCYTPMAVVDGGSHVVGSKARAVTDGVSKARSSQKPVRVTFRLEGDSIVASKADDAGGRFLITLCAVAPAAKQKIGRGENGGRTLSNSNVVVYFSSESVSVSSDNVSVGSVTSLLATARAKQSAAARTATGDKIHAIAAIAQLSGSYEILGAALLPVR